MNFKLLSFSHFLKEFNITFLCEDVVVYSREEIKNNGRDFYLNPIEKSFFYKSDSLTVLLFKKALETKTRKDDLLNCVSTILDEYRSDSFEARKQLFDLYFLSQLNNFELLTKIVGLNKQTYIKLSVDQLSKLFQLPLEQLEQLFQESFFDFYCKNLLDPIGSIFSMDSWTTYSPCFVEKILFARHYETNPERCDLYDKIIAKIKKASKNTKLFSLIQKIMLNTHYKPHLKIIVSNSSNTSTFNYIKYKEDDYMYPLDPYIPIIDSLKKTIPFDRNLFKRILEVSIPNFYYLQKSNNNTGFFNKLKDKYYTFLQSEENMYLFEYSVLSRYVDLHQKTSYLPSNLLDMYENDFFVFSGKFLNVILNLNHETFEEHPELNPFSLIVSKYGKQEIKQKYINFLISQEDNIAYFFNDVCFCKELAVSSDPEFFKQILDIYESKINTTDFTQEMYLKGLSECMINHSSIFSHLIFKISEINTKEFIPLYLDYLEIANYKKECLLSNFSFFISKLGDYNNQCCNQTYDQDNRLTNILNILECFDNYELKSYKDNIISLIKLVNRPLSKKLITKIVFGNIDLFQNINIEYLKDNLANFYHSEYPYIKCDIMEKLIDKGLDLDLNTIDTPDENKRLKKELYLTYAEKKFQKSYIDIVCSGYNDIPIFNYPFKLYKYCLTLGLRQDCIEAYSIQLNNEELQSLQLDFFNSKLIQHTDISFDIMEALNAHKNNPDFFTKIQSKVKWNSLSKFSKVCKHLFSDSDVVDTLKSNLSYCKTNTNDLNDFSVLLKFIVRYHQGITGDYFYGSDDLDINLYSLELIKKPYEDESKLFSLFTFFNPYTCSDNEPSVGFYIYQSCFVYQLSSLNMDAFLQITGNSQLGQKQIDFLNTRFSKFGEESVLKILMAHFNDPNFNFDDISNPNIVHMMKNYSRLPIFIFRKLINKQEGLIAQNVDKTLFMQVFASSMKSSDNFLNRNQLLDIISSYKFLLDMQNNNSVFTPYSNELICDDLISKLKYKMNSDTLSDDEILLFNALFISKTDAVLKSFKMDKGFENEFILNIEKSVMNCNLQFLKTRFENTEVNTKKIDFLVKLQRYFKADHAQRLTQLLDLNLEDECINPRLLNMFFYKFSYDYIDHIKDFLTNDPKKFVSVLQNFDDLFFNISKFPDRPKKFHPKLVSNNLIPRVALKRKPSDCDELKVALKPQALTHLFDKSIENYDLEFKQWQQKTLATSFEIFTFNYNNTAHINKLIQVIRTIFNSNLDTLVTSINSNGEISEAESVSTLLDAYLNALINKCGPHSNVTNSKREHYFEALQKLMFHITKFPIYKDYIISEIFKNHSVCTDGFITRPIELFEKLTLLKTGIEGIILNLSQDILSKVKNHLGLDNNSVIGVHQDYDIRQISYYYALRDKLDPDVDRIANLNPAHLKNLCKEIERTIFQVINGDYVLDQYAKQLITDEKDRFNSKWATFGWPLSTDENYDEKENFI